ncbi:hypothetical protein PBI_SCTP2_92 [Salicola phage SCTP-2]|nr:hypothetical protein PBI_SCTP2_92 [Salicola phage SCTP-2]
MSKVTLEQVFEQLDTDETKARELMREYIIQCSRSVYEDLMESDMSDEDILTDDLESELQQSSEELESMDDEVSAENMYDDEDVDASLDDVQSGEDAIDDVEDRVENIEDELEELRKDFEELVDDEEGSEEGEMDDEEGSEEGEMDDEEGSEEGEMDDEESMDDSENLESDIEEIEDEETQ